MSHGSSCKYLLDRITLITSFPAAMAVLEAVGLRIRARRFESPSHGHMLRGGNMGSGWLWASLMRGSSRSDLIRREVRIYEQREAVDAGTMVQQTGTRSTQPLALVRREIEWHGPFNTRIQVQLGV